MQIELNTTIFINGKKQEIHKELPVSIDFGEENNVINLYPEVKYQTFLGFGGAITDSAGYVYSLMEDEQKKELITNYFTKEGMNYKLARIHLDSCDFSVDQYEAMSDLTDLELSSFSMERTNKYIIPLFQDASRVCETPIEVMVSPWSPPAFMKTNGERCNGGKLKESYRSFWANYICKYIKELRKLGLQITCLTMQNEPNATQTWDSCVYSPEEEKIFLRDYLYPALAKQGLTDIGIFLWDHNKERVYERAAEIIDETTNHMIQGIAFHWYSGDHFEALRLIKEKYPDKVLVLSEACIEYCKYGNDNYLFNAQKYAHDMIGNLNNGMQAFYDWNILLDQEGGPNHVKNYCDAPYLYDTEKRELVKRSSLYYIKHFTHYILPGAIRIAHTTYTDQLEVTAFKNPDHSISCILLNRTKEEKKVNLRMSGQITEFTVLPSSISTIEIN